MGNINHSTTPRSYGAAANDPQGSVSIIDIATRNVTTANLDGVMETGSLLRKNTGMDFEPEYIAVNKTGTKAYVGLQEANGMGVLNLLTNTFEKIIGLGAKDFNAPGNEIDPRNNSTIAFGNYAAKGLYMPDGMATFQAGGKTYVVMANEGDFREDDGDRSAASSLGASGDLANLRIANDLSVSGGGEPPAAAANNGASDTVIVLPAATNTFAPDGAQTALPGTSVAYPHTFVAGLAGTVSFSTTAVASPAVPGWTQVIYRDANCNGVLDGAESAAPLAAGIAVSAGQSVCIVVVDNVPANAPYNAINAISVTATFTGPLTYTRTDVTTVGAPGGAGLTLGKSVRNVTPGGGAGRANTARPNDVLEDTVTFANGGTGALTQTFSQR